MPADLLCDVHKELANAARRETSSVLRARGYDAMSILSCTEIIKKSKLFVTQNSVSFLRRVGRRGPWKRGWPYHVSPRP